MRYLFDNINDIQARLKNKKCFLFLDYDGTLVPISKTPDLAVLPVKTRRHLEHLSECADCKIAIVSGRAVADLKRLVKIKDLVFIGNHGWEIRETATPVKMKQTKEQKYSMWKVCKALQEKLSIINGILVEDKGYSITVHYRNASSTDEKPVKKIINEIVKDYVQRKTLKLREGKKILEILPATEWHKGSAAKSVYSYEAGQLNSFIPVCVGDDKTDEDLFKEFKGIGITVKVGENEDSSAEFFLKDHLEVQKFLEVITGNIAQKPSQNNKKVSHRA